MTTSAGPRKAKKKSRALPAQLSVIAVSMVALAASWFGIVRLDEARAADAAAVQTTTSVSAPVNASSATTLVPAPRTTSQTATVRTSRAS